MLNLITPKNFHFWKHLHPTALSNTYVKKNPPSKIQIQKQNQKKPPQNPTDLSTQCMHTQVFIQKCMHTSTNSLKSEEMKGKVLFANILYNFFE